MTTGAPKSSPRNVLGWLKRCERMRCWGGETPGTLRAVYDGGTPQESIVVATVETSGGLVASPELAAELVELCQGDCDGRGSRAAYLLQLYDGDHAKATHPLRLKPAESEDGFGEDAPTTSGLLGMLMRQNKDLVAANSALIRQQQQNMSTVLDAQTRMLAASLEYTAKLEGTLADVREELEEARAGEPEGWVEKVSVLVDKIEPLLPMLIGGGGGDAPKGPAS